MSENIDYAARVQRGAALLDEKWPTWVQDIDLDALDIGSSDRCVTAQYAGQVHGHADFVTGMDKLGLSIGSYADHGFNIAPTETTGFPTLTALWRDLITERRSAAQPPEASER